MTPKPTPTRGVPVVLDKERRLRYTLGTMRLIREKFGEDRMAQGVPAAMLGELLWYGLKHEDAQLTIEQVEDMVDGENLEAITAALVKAFGQKLENPRAATASSPEVVAPQEVGAEASQPVQERKT